MDHRTFDALARAFSSRSSRRQALLSALGAAIGAARLPELAQAARGGNHACDGNKVLWCHCPPGNLSNCRILCIARSGTNGHSGHANDCSCEDHDCACAAGAEAGGVCRPASPLNGECMMAGDCQAGLECRDNRCAAPCVPSTCESAKAMCGTIANGCGGTIDCGNCGKGYHCVLDACVADSCGAVGAACSTPGECCDGLQCSGGACAKPCTPATCQDRKAECGSISDGCGNVLDCGKCTDDSMCVDNRCVRKCEVKSCRDRNVECGPADNGCGGKLWCGNCESGQDCEHGICVRKCQRATCETMKRTCGKVTDGCDGTLDCGMCQPNEVCTPEGACAPQQSKACSVETESCVSNGCCPGLGCVSGVCTSPCVPVTCQDMGVQCGPMSNGCSATTDCGACAADMQCMAGVCQPNKLMRTGGECTSVSECERGNLCSEDTCIEPKGMCRAIGESCENADCCGGLLCSQDSSCVEMTQQCAQKGEDCSDHPCCDLSETCVPTASGHQCQTASSRENTTGGGNQPGGGNGNGKNNGGTAACLHVGGRPGPGERCCPRLHIEKGQCVINRWDHCDQSNQGQASFCERGATCEGKRISPHHQEVCVPRKHRNRVLAAGL